MNSIVGAVGASPKPNTGGSLKPVGFATRGDFVGILDRLGVSLVAATQPNQIILLGAVDGDTHHDDGTCR